MVAVSPFVVKTEKGIELMESEPTLKVFAFYNIKAVKFRNVLASIFARVLQV